MQITVDDIMAFVKVAEYRSFNRAADELGITQSALSRRLKKLEDNLGSKVLDRTTRKIGLTVVGNEFLPMATRMVSDFEKSLSDIIDVIQIRAGIISMSSNMTIADTLLPEVLSRFGDAYPNIQIRITEDSSPATVERIIRGEVEFGIAQIDETSPDIDFEPLIDDPFVMVCHPDHPLAEHEAVCWSDLNGHSFIKMQPGSGTWGSLQRSLDDLAVSLDGRFEVAHLAALLALVGKNLGISAIPRLGALKRPDLKLVTRPLQSPSVNRVIGIVKLRGHSLSPAAEALQGYVREVLSEYQSPEQ